MSALADRIREIVRATPAREQQSTSASTPSGFSGTTEHVPSGFPPPPNASARLVEGRSAREGGSRTSGDLASILGGVWRDGYLVIERTCKPSARHGHETIGSVAERLELAAGEAVRFAHEARTPFVFFDLETTGLSGGAGIHVFLVGCGRFEADGAFLTRQYLLTSHAQEKMLLAALAGELARVGALVSFNGKSFDVPMLETRYLFHRLPWTGEQVAHFDVLHPARRFWGRTEHALSMWRAEGSLGRTGDCSLTALERAIVGLKRTGDVPGFEVPSRYFQFVRTGDARPLVAILEHNRLDLLTLATITAQLLHIVRLGPDGARTSTEALALGRVYASGGDEERARAAFTRAIQMSRAPAGAFDPVRVDALRALALAWRRVRRFDHAVGCWRQLADMRGCPPRIVREATEALAIHHEHRVRDLVSARAFALQSLEAGLHPAPQRGCRRADPTAWTRAIEHRLERIERKLQVRSLKYEV